MKKQTEKLNVRDFVTIAILTVVELAVYFVIGMPLGSTQLSWIFCLGIQALPLVIVFMLMYTKVNKKGTVLISGLLLSALLLMSLWMVSLCVAAAAIIGEIIWEKCDRKKFSTMLICYTILMVGWYVGAFAPLILLKDMYIASLPTMAEFNTQVFNLVAGPLFFVALAETAVGGIAGSFLGKAILKKHFQKAGIV